MNQRAVIPSGARDLAQGDKSLKLKSVIIGKREVLRSAQNDRAHQHGLRASRFALSRRWADRVSVFIGGPCRCVGLHRNHDTVRARADDYSSDRACA